MRPIRAMLIQMGNRSGGAGVDLSDALAYNFAIDPSDATATFSVTSGGTATNTGAAGQTWLLSGAAGDYDVRATLASGSSPTGSALATWHDCGTTRSWTLTQTTVGLNTCTLTVEIRNGTTLAVLATATITITAEVTS